VTTDAATAVSPVPQSVRSRPDWLAYAELGDPLATQLTRLRHPAVILGFAWLAVTVGVDLVLTVPQGIFFSRPPVVSGGPPAFIGWWFDLATLLQEVVVFPMLAFFYLWAPRALLRAIRSLRDDQIIEIRPDDETWLDAASRGRQPGWLAALPAAWLLIAVVGAAAVVAYLLFWGYTSVLAGRLWFAEPDVARVKVVFWLLNSYMAIWLLVRMAILVELLARLFAADRAVRIEPLHPDGAGGLAPLSGFSLRLTTFIGLIGATFVLVERNYFFQYHLQLMPQALPVHGIAVFALVASVFVFFAPLLAPHRIMAGRKRQRLAELAQQFRQVEQAIDPARLDSLSAAAPQLQLIRSVYAEVERFPVWPFDTRILRLFFVAVVGQPALAVVIDIFKTDLKDLLRGFLGA
jgi:hypothetical protein